MEPIIIDLPDSAAQFLAQEVEAGGYASTSDYLCDLIRREEDRCRTQALVRDGMESGPGSVVDEAYVQRLRDRVRRGIS